MAFPVACPVLRRPAVNRVVPVLVPVIGLSQIVSEQIAQGCAKQNDLSHNNLTYHWSLSVLPDFTSFSAR